MVKREQINIDVDPGLKEIIDLAAKAERRSRNNWILNTLIETLIQKGHKNKLRSVGL